MITVIIPTYDRLRLLERAIGSVLAQTERDWELLIVGDGCSWETTTAIRGFLELLDDPRIRFQNNVRQVYPADPEAAWRVAGADAVNWGLDHARGELVTLLGDDDELPPSALHSLLDALGDADGVYGRCEVVGCGTLAPALAEGHIQSALWRRSDYRYDPAATHPADWDLWARMIADGKRFAFTPEYAYRYHPTGHVPATEPLVCAVIPTRFRPPELAPLLEVLAGDGVIPLVLDSPDYDHRIYRMWNAGVERAKAQHPGALVAVLNDDIAILPGTLPLLARALRAHPELGVIYPDWRQWHEALPASVALERTTGTHAGGGMTGFCFMFDPERAPAFDESYRWWYGDDAFEEAVRAMGLGVGRAIDVPIRHWVDGSARKVWSEIEPLTVADRNLWESRHRVEVAS